MECESADGGSSCVLKDLNGHEDFFPAEEYRKLANFNTVVLRSPVTILVHNLHISEGLGG